jgi:hypothetical protein
MPTSAAGGAGHAEAAQAEWNRRVRANEDAILTACYDEQVLREAGIL